MLKKVHNDVLDGMLNILKNNVTTQIVCATEPIDRAAALLNPLASVAMVPADFTIADDISGRKVTSAIKINALITFTGISSHIAYIDGTRLLYVTTCTAQALVANGVDTVNFPPWKINVGAPT